jgi:hypothetical protein
VLAVTVLEEGIAAGYGAIGVKRPPTAVFEEVEDPVLPTFAA